ncbi:caspase family protein [Mammaliicoccus sciuri]|uniref:caspase family protein n=1 Tax=Mammaliicoccus sciuri TaxID=1296 RepID=UPI002DBB9C4B|nr:caspase family protein [Mammaliicoccus sciuri]MEB7734167.1 caspase family protein [Mammaliicoccus sciuri]
MSVKALVVGVSDYSAISQSNLDFCVNDIAAVSKSLIYGLSVEKENIYTLGNDRVVNRSDFIKTLHHIRDNIKKDDTFIFYFSGHGGNLSDGHHLVFSDKTFNTQKIIKILDSISSKNKLIILDSCMSGNFRVDETSVFDSNTKIIDFFGTGYAVISSSNNTQYSWVHPTKSLSLFTSFLCEAFTDNLLIKEGNKSLSDIQKLLSLYLDVWNKNNPNRAQKPIFRANIGGTILFPVEAYTPYQTKSYYYESDDYIIYDVKPLHTGIAKRYSVSIILKYPFSFEEISNLNHKIIKIVNKLEIFKDRNEENKWKNKKANIIFSYFGRDEFDVTNNNYICHTTWVDETQDKNKWYNSSGKCEVINDIHFNFHTYYDTLKTFQQDNTGEKDSIISHTKEIISNLISLSEKVIRIYNEFLNETKSEDEFVEDLNKLIPSIEKWYYTITDLNLPPKELKKWFTACLGLAGTIHDFTLYYNNDGLTKRSFDNRIACMNNTKDRYYKELSKLCKEEQVISSLLYSSSD